MDKMFGNNSNQSINQSINQSTSNGGRKLVRIIKYGVFYKVIGNDSLIVNYLIGVKIKNNTCYLNNITIERLINKLDSLHIDYYHNNMVHNFVNNNYNVYLDYGYKKRDIDREYLSLISKIEDYYER